MAQRRDQIEPSAYQAKSWVLLGLLLLVLLLVIPGIPASLSMAAGSSLVVLLGLSVHRSKSGHGGAADNG